MDAGKSTLLRSLVRILRPTSGSIHIDGVDVQNSSPVRQSARTVAAVLQDVTGDFDLRARDVVAMGRAPYKRMFQGDGAADERIVDDALRMSRGRPPR